MQAPFFMPTTGQPMTRTVSRTGSSSTGSMSDRGADRSTERTSDETSGRTGTERSGAANTPRTSAAANTRKADRNTDSETGSASGETNPFLAEIIRAAAEQGGPLDEALSRLLGEDWRDILESLPAEDADQAASLMAAFPAVPMTDAGGLVTSLTTAGAGTTVSGETQLALAALAAMIPTLTADAAATGQNSAATDMEADTGIIAPAPAFEGMLAEIVKTLTPDAEVLPDQGEGTGNGLPEQWFQRLFPEVTAAASVRTAVPVMPVTEAPVFFDGATMDAATEVATPAITATDAPLVTESTPAETRPATPAQPVFQAGVMEQVTRNLRGVLSRTGPSEIRVSLRPPTLGDVHLRVSSDQQRISIRIMAEVPAVRDVIEQNLNQLRADLQAQGLDVAGIDVMLSEDFRESGNPETFAETGKGETGETPAPVASVIGDVRAAAFTAATSGTRSGRIDYFA